MIDILGVGAIEFPDEMSDDDISRAIENDILPYANPDNPDPELVRARPDLFPDIDRGSFFGGLGSGARRVGRLDEVAGAAIGRSESGLGSLTDQMGEEAVRSQYRATPTDALNQWRKGDYLGAAGTYFLDVVPQSLGETVPELAGIGAGTVAGAKIGAAIGTTAGPAGTVVGGIVGGIAGGIAAGAPLFFGQNVERQVAERDITDPNEINTGAAAAAAVGQAALEQVFLRAIRVIPGAQNFGRSQIQRLVEQGTRTINKKGAAAEIGRTALVGGATESVVEVGQQALERLQAGLPISPADEAAAAEYVEAFVLGGTLGTAIGGGAQVAKTPFGKRKLDEVWGKLDAEREAFELQRRRASLGAMGVSTEEDGSLSTPMLMLPAPDSRNNNTSRQRFDPVYGDSDIDYVELVEERLAANRDKLEFEAAERQRRVDDAVNAAPDSKLSPAQRDTAEQMRLQKEALTSRKYSIEELEAGNAPAIAKAVAEREPGRGDYAVDQTSFSLADIENMAASGSITGVDEATLTEELYQLRYDGKPRTELLENVDAAKIKRVAQEKNVNPEGENFEALSEYLTGETNPDNATPFRRVQMYEALQRMDPFEGDTPTDVFDVSEPAFSYEEMVDAEADVIERGKWSGTKVAEKLGIKGQGRKAKLEALRGRLIENGLVNDANNEATLKPRKSDIPEEVTTAPFSAFEGQGAVRYEVQPVEHNAQARENRPDDAGPLPEFAVVAVGENLADETGNQVVRNVGRRVISTHASQAEAEAAAGGYGSTKGETDVDLRAKWDEQLKQKFKEGAALDRLRAAVNDANERRGLQEAGIPASLVADIDAALNRPARTDGVSEGVFVNNAILLGVNAAARTTNPNLSEEAREQAILESLLAVLSHEQIHALREIGAISETDFAVLARAASTRVRPVGLQAASTKAEGRTYLEDARIAYADQNLSEDALNEEAVAEMFRDWSGDPSLFTGKPANIFRRVLNLIKGLANFFRNQGITDVNEIFENIDSGQAARDATGANATGSGVEAKLSVRDLEDVDPTNPGIRYSVAEARAGAYVGNTEGTNNEQRQQSVQAGTDPEGPAAGEELADTAGRTGETLRGIPEPQGATGPLPELGEVARAYAKRQGIKYKPQGRYVEVDEVFATRVADAFKAMKHNPQDPEVFGAYSDMIRQTSSQYEALIDAGYTFSFMDPDADPYEGNPVNAMRDLHANKRMAIYPTKAGFGMDETLPTPKENPLMWETDYLIPDADGVMTPMLANDVFRAVHDVFGHGLEGAGFRAQGEENAFQAHIKLYTGRAVGAVASETRGQNSWLNYGPYGEQNRTASVYETVFADQKIGLMPEWAYTENLDLGFYLPADIDGMVELTHRSNTDQLTETDPEFFGAAAAGDETARRDAHPDAWVPRTYFGIGEGTEGGYVSEFGDSSPLYHASVPADRLYDWNSDPEKFLEKARKQSPLSNNMVDEAKATTLAEKMIRDAGYMGYWSRAKQGAVAALFEKTNVTPAKLSSRGMTGRAQQEMDRKAERDAGPLRRYSVDVRRPGKKTITRQFMAHSLTEAKEKAFASPLLKRGAAEVTNIRLDDPTFQKDVDAPKFSIRKWARELEPYEFNEATRIVPMSPKAQASSDLPDNVRGMAWLTKEEMLPVILMKGVDIDGAGFGKEHISAKAARFGGLPEMGAILRKMLANSHTRGAPGNYNVERYIPPGKLVPDSRALDYRMSWTDPTTNIEYILGLEKVRKDGLYYASITTFFPKSAEADGRAATEDDIAAYRSQRDRQTPGARFSVSHPNSSEFWDLMGDTDVVSSDGLPKVLYHSTNRDFDDGTFSPESSNYPHGAIFVTEDTEFANGWRSEPYEPKTAHGWDEPQFQRVIPLYVKAKNVWDFRNPEHRKLLIDQERDYLNGTWEDKSLIEPWLQKLDRDLSEGDWIEIERRNRQDAIYANGFSGYAVRETPIARDADPVNYGFYPDRAIFKSPFNKTFDPKDPKFSVASRHPYRPENNTYELLTEKNKTLWNRALTQLKRQLAPGGLLPESAFDLKIERDGEINVIEIEVTDRVARFDRALRKAYGKRWDQLPSKQQDKINELLHGEGNVTGVPDAVRVAIFQMRQQVDKLSGDYVKTLRRQIAALRAEGRDQMANNRAELLEVIANNIGTYVHRSYRVHDDPGWFRKISPEVVQKAMDFLTVQHNGDQTAALRTAELLLKEGTAYDNLEAQISEGKLGAVDRSILMRRKDIAPEIRALLGEYTDPALNYTKTATKMGRVIHNSVFLDRVLKDGLGTFLHDPTQGPPPPGSTVRLAGDTSRIMEPLAGLYTTPEVAQAFEDALGRSDGPAWYNQIVALNAMVKYGKTILSPTTQFRNFYSAYFFTVANGAWSWKHMGAAARATGAHIGQLDNGAKDYYLELVRSGVTHNNPRAGMLMDLLEDMTKPNSEIMSFFERGGAFTDSVKRMNSFAQRMYAAGDDFWKVIGFENELAYIMEAKNQTREQATPEAARRIRDTYPTYSMVGRGVQKLRKFPMAGTFVSFPAEIIRTRANMIRYIARDLKDPRMAGLARKRMVGFAISSAWSFSLANLTASMMGLTDDEEEALRLMGSPWAENSQFFYMGRDEKGQIKKLDMSFADPYNIFSRPFTALTRGQDVDDAVTSAMRDVLSPFFGTDIAFGAVMEIVSNKKQTGGEVYNPADTSIGQTTDAALHLGKALSPGALTWSYRMSDALRGRRSPSGRVYDVKDEAAAFFGFRVSTFDPKVSLYYRTFEFTDRLSNARSLLYGVATDINPVSDSKVKSTFAQANKVRLDAFRDLGKFVRSAESAGLSRGEIRRILDTANVPKQYIARVVNEREAPRWKIGETFLQGAMQRSRLLIDRETSEEIRRRRKLIQEEARGT